MVLEIKAIINVFVCPRFTVFLLQEALSYLTVFEKWISVYLKWVHTCTCLLQESDYIHL